MFKQQTFNLLFGRACEMDKRPFFSLCLNSPIAISVNIWQIIFYVLVLMRMPFQSQHIECGCQVHKRTQTNRYKRHFRNCWQMAFGSAPLFSVDVKTKSRSLPVYPFHCWSMDTFALLGILRISYLKSPFWPAASPFVFLRLLDVFPWHSFFLWKKFTGWYILVNFLFTAQYNFFLSMKNDAAETLRYVLIFLIEICIDATLHKFWAHQKLWCVM